MGKEMKLTAAEEKQIKIEKMRRIRDIREQEIDDYNKDRNDDERLDVDVKDINFLGKIKIEHEVDGEKQTIEMDIYREIEMQDGEVIPRYYEENANLVGTKTSDYGLMIAEEYRDISEEIVRQIEALEERQKGKVKDEEELSLNEEEKELARRLLKNSNNSKKDDKDKDEDSEKDEDEVEEIPEEELKKRVPSIQEVDLDQVVDDEGTHLRDKLKLPPEYTKLEIGRTDQVSDISEVDRSTEFSIMAFNSETGNTEPLPDLELDMASGNNPTNETVKINEDGDIDIDNKTKSRYMIGDCTLSIENGEYGEIKVYFGSKAKNSNEYVETQLETNQVWPTPKKVREMQEERRGMYRFDDMAKEAKAHDGEECEDELTVEDIDGDILTYSDEHVEELCRRIKCSEAEGRRLIDEYRTKNPDMEIHDVIDDIEEEINGDFTNPRGY